MNQQQKDEFFEEEKNFRAKRAGCLLVLGAIVVEAIAVAAGTAYYLKNKEEDKSAEPVKVSSHHDLKNKAQTEHTR